MGATSINRDCNVSEKKLDQFFGYYEPSPYPSVNFHFISYFHLKMWLSRPPSPVGGLCIFSGITHYSWTESTNPPHVHQANGNQTPGVWLFEWTVRGHTPKMRARNKKKPEWFFPSHCPHFWQKNSSFNNHLFPRVWSSLKSMWCSHSIN